MSKLYLQPALPVPVQSVLLLFKQQQGSGITEDGRNYFSTVGLFLKSESNGRTSAISKVSIIQTEVANEMKPVYQKRLLTPLMMIII